MKVATIACLLWVLAACSSTSASTSSTPSPSGPTGTPKPAGTLSLVGLGDSVAGAAGCQACPSFVVTYGTLAQKALGKPVTVTNLASNDSATTITTLSLLTDDPDTRAAVAQADIVTVTIGANDWQGPCTDSGAEACLEQGRQTVGDSLGQILDEVAKLRAGQPTAVRVTTYYNSVIGNPSTAEQWAFTPSPAKNASFQAMYAKALGALNTTICRVAVEHSATCVDLLHPFNGPQANREAGDLLLEDHVHPSGKGHVLIARTLDAVGYAPLA